MAAGKHWGWMTGVSGFSRHELGQTLEDGEGTGSLVCHNLVLQRVGHDLKTEQQQHSS